MQEACCQVSASFFFLLSREKGRYDFVIFDRLWTRPNVVKNSPTSTRTPVSNRSWCCLCRHHRLSRSRMLRSSGLIICPKNFPKSYTPIARGVWYICARAFFVTEPDILSDYLITIKVCTNGCTISIVILIKGYVSTIQYLIVRAGRGQKYHPGWYFGPFANLQTPTVQFHELVIIPYYVSS